VGKLGDLEVRSNDVVTCPVEGIPYIRCVLTVVRGRVVLQAQP
jgi:predicted amidohydrolase YtcJ